MGPADLETWRRNFDLVRAKAIAYPPIGRISLKPCVAGEYRYAIAVRGGDSLWVALWIRRSPKGDIYVLYPRRVPPDSDLPPWNPHTSYHRDGRFHSKSYDLKFESSRKRQPITSAFRGAEALGHFHGYSPKSEGAECHFADYTDVIEVPNGILGPRDGFIAVDLVQPGQYPTVLDNSILHSERVLKDVGPWLVVRIASATL